MDAFLEEIRRIAQSAPVYREGGTGADGTCDCIGLVMGAMYALGRSRYELHSSNYFARRQTDRLTPLLDAAQLSPGMIVYKARTATDALNVRYQPGGSCYNGDLLDYYHAGVVESVRPLSIVHCTSSGNANGIVIDNGCETWTHCGYVAGLEEPEMDVQTAIVTASSGKTVNLRKRPDLNAPLVMRVQVDAAVTVHESADGWAKVTVDGEPVYMMEAFLRREDVLEQWVKLPLQAVLDIIETLKAYAAAKTKEELF